MGCGNLSPRSAVVQVKRVQRCWRSLWLTSRKESPKTALLLPIRGLLFVLAARGSLHMTRRLYPCERPAFLTGTSAEYLGCRPLPSVLCGRPNVVLLGPLGCGKTTVAWFIAGPDALYLDKHGTQNALVAHVRRGSWSDRLSTAPNLILDGPVWLSHRPAAVDALRDLLDKRESEGLRTVVIQDPRGGSVYPLISERAPGSTVLVGLRFPEGRSRRRFVRTLVDELGVPPALGYGLLSLQPWTYQRVAEEVRRRIRQQGNSPANADPGSADSVHA
jgi:hypothetical protein